MVQLIMTLTLSLFATSAFAGSQFTCKYSNPAIGQILGKGQSQRKAFEDAAEKCFDRHQMMTAQLRGPDEAKKRGSLHIDICANIRCSK